MRDSRGRGEEKEEKGWFSLVAQRATSYRRRGRARAIIDQEAPMPQLASPRELIIIILIDDGLTSGRESRFGTCVLAKRNR